MPAIPVGSGMTPENLHKALFKVDGFMVGSYFKKDGKADNLYFIPTISFAT